VCVKPVYLLKPAVADMTSLLRV